MDQTSRFKSSVEEELFNGVSSKATRRLLPEQLHAVAIRRIDVVIKAATLEDLRANPGSRLHALRGTREGHQNASPPTSHKP